MPMSAADPATPERGFMNSRGHGAVIDITKRRGGGRTATAEARGRWNAMSTPPGHGHNRTPIELVADDIEKWFNATQRSLTNPETAAVFVIAADFFQHVMEGAVGTGLITEEQRGQLYDLFETAKQSLDHI